MKKFGLAAIGWVSVLAMLAFGPRAMAQEEYPGAFYFGDSNPGDGVLGPGDLSVLKTQLATGAGAYAGCNPAYWDVQEIDGDAVPGPGDLNILITWITGNFATGDAGKPFVLEPVNPTNQVPADGGTVICVTLADNPANGDMIKTPRAGWGVIFQIDPSSPCPTATLYGRDPTPTIGLGKNQFVTAPVGDKVYGYTSRIGDGGKACFTINATGCSDAQVIPITYYVPGDDEALYQVGSKGRFPTRLDGTPAQIPITVVGCCSHVVTVTPDPAALNDGASIQMTATDDIDGDVTAGATWAIASGTCSVSAAGKVSAPEGCSTAACVVQATYLGQSDTATVNITDNEAGTWDQITLACAPVNDGGPISCAGTRRSSIDGCARGASTCAPACTSPNCAGNNVNEGCANGTYTATCSESISRDLWLATGPDDFEDQDLKEYTVVDGDFDGYPPYIMNTTLGGGNSGYGVFFGDHGNVMNAMGDAIVAMVTTVGKTSITFSGRIWTCNTDAGEYLEAQFTCNNGGSWTTVAHTEYTLGGAACPGDVQNFSQNLSLINACVNNNPQFGVRIITPSGKDRNDEVFGADNLYITGSATVAGAGGATVIDNEAGSWDALRNPICGTGNDIINVAATCSVPQRYSTADNCDRGPATCAWTCAAGACAELCYPTASGVFTGRCADGAVNSQDGGTVTNNEMVPTSVDLTPNGPISGIVGATRPLACGATFADACVYNAGTAAVSDPVGCGAESGMVYHFDGAPPDCSEAVTCNVAGVSDAETLTSYLLCPTISTAFPLAGQPGVALRYSGNAHLYQAITIVYSPMPAGAPATATVQCTGPSTVNFVCNLANEGVDADIPCVPTSNFLELGTYSCTATLTKAGCANAVTTANLTIAQTASPVDGGMGAGYVGGLTYESGTTTVGPGTVTITAVDAEINTAIPGKVYVQIIQNGVVTERYTNAFGVLSISLADAPIDELTLGYKCGAQTCPKREAGATVAQWKAGNTRDYQYTTLHDVDASDVVVRMSHMGNAQLNRFRYIVRGTISENYFTSYISPRPLGAGSSWSPSAARLLAPPVKLRAALVLSTFHDLQAMATGLDSLFLSADSEVSITACVYWRHNVSKIFKTALPPNLILPDIRRTQWFSAAGCAGWATNPGVYAWEYWLTNATVYENLWSVGAYINATNMAFTAGLDLKAFPISVCALGMRRIFVPSMEEADNVLNIGTNAGFRYDLREDWPGSLGYDPDVTIDRKILINAGPLLPIDPARQTATLRPISTYRVPNSTDAELIGDATWDDRFYRKDVIFVTGADFGLAAGLGVCGLNLQNSIDDAQFTTFKVGYFQSTGTKLGQRDLRYWLTSSADTEVVSTTLAGPNSSWTDPSFTNIDWTARESGGPTNYLAIAILTRSGPQEGRSSDPSFLLNYGQGSKFKLDVNLSPGSIASIYHVSPPESAGTETIQVVDWLNLTVALAPNPDAFIYPAPQWGNTIRGSIAINRNGELWRVRTTGLSDRVPTDSTDPWARYYFRFTRPTMQKATSRAIHAWRLALAEDGIGTGDDGVSNVGMVHKRSIKSKVFDHDGYASGTNEFNDPDAHFLTQGVQVGDSLWVNSRRNGCYNTYSRIVSVVSQTQVLVSPNWAMAPNCIWAGDTNIFYRIIRQTARGDCEIDEMYGGGAPGYGCLPNRFWTAQGPANSATQKVNVPAVTPGAATLNGVTGYRPEFWGMAAGTQIEWTHAYFVYNTGAFIQGGLAGAFDWNNQDWRSTISTTNFASTDTHKARYQ